MSFLYRFPIRIRLLAIIFAFLVPISALVYFMVSSINANITFSEMEIKGNRYYRPLIHLQKEVMAYRFAVLRADAGIDTSKERETIAARIEHLLHDLRQVEQHIGKDLQFTTEALAKRHRGFLTISHLSRHWEMIKTSKSPAPDDFDSLLYNVREMISYAGDTSNLILDPDLDSYYLMDVTLLAMPKTFQRKAEIMNLVYPKIGKNKPLSPEDRAEAKLLISLIKESGIERITADMHRVLDEDLNFHGISEGVKTKLYPALRHYQQQEKILTTLLEALIAGKPVSAKQFSTAFNTAHQASIDFAAIAVDELDALIHKRVDNYTHQRTVTLIWCLGAFFVALLLFWVLTLSITKPLRRLQSSMQSLTAGKLDIEIPCRHQRDEPGDMARCVELFRINAVEKERLKTQLQDYIEEVLIAQSEALQAKAEAEKSSQSKSDFLANMSHELRTPMHAILNYSKTGIKRLDKADKQLLEKYFSNIFTSGDRLSRLLNNLLDMSKIEAGKMEYHFREQSLKKALEQMQIELQSLLDAKHLMLRVQEQTDNLIANFDYERIVQVMVNLLSNAIKFTPDKSTITITVSEDKMKIQEKDYPVLRIQLADQGVGIPKGELQTIFDKFIQSSKTKTGAGGTGLGLSISNDIIKAHHGKIWAENNPDGGASFIFYLHRNIPGK